MIIRTILLGIIWTAILSAKFDAVPTQSCEAYNNLKHSKNTHHIVLDPHRSYTVIKKHKGQYLVKIPNESPSTRWVDSSCFAGKQKENTRSATTNKLVKPANKSNPNRQDLLVLSWENTFCQSHSRTRECRILEKQGKSLLALHGLWPQPKSKNYCGVPRKLVAKDKHHQWRALPKLQLSDTTRDMMNKLMPGSLSALHRHEWIKHGTCYGTDAEQYFSQALSWTEQIANGTLGKLLQTNIGKRLSLKQLQNALEKDFGKGAGYKLDMRCDRGNISELWLHLGGNSNNLSERLAAGSNARSRCRSGIVDAPGL